MADLWTKPRVLELAPDAASAKAGQGQANPAKWPTLGQSAGALWGEVQGSGKHPYQVRIDLAGPAYKCSCPSRKFPCKHALGLLLILAEQPQKIAVADPPEWVAEWLASRQKRAETKAEKPAKPVDPVAQAKRAEKREANVGAGIDELRRYLRDIVRQGLVGVQSQPGRYWEEMAARLVDAQAPGLARRVRELGETAGAGTGWHGRFVRQLARLYLAAAGYERQENHSPQLRADLRTEIGWTQSRDELAELPGEQGTWCVVSQRVTEEDRLTVQRTWLLRQEDARFALLLEFAPAGQPLGSSLMVGTSFEGEVVYYPGGAPLRAQLKERQGEPSLIGDCPGLSTIAEGLDQYAQALAANPWLDVWPLSLAEVTPFPARHGDSLTWQVEDSQRDRLPLRGDDDAMWQLYALSGGEPVTLVGVWDGEALGPLGVVCEGTYAAWTRQGAKPWLARVT